MKIIKILTPLGKKLNIPWVDSLGEVSELGLDPGHIVLLNGKFCVIVIFDQPWYINYNSIFMAEDDLIANKVSKELSGEQDSRRPTAIPLVVKDPEFTLIAIDEEFLSLRGKRHSMKNAEDEFKKAYMNRPPQYISKQGDMRNVLIPPSNKLPRSIWEKRNH